MNKMNITKIIKWTFFTFAFTASGVFFLNLFGWISLPAIASPILSLIIGINLIIISYINWKEKEKTKNTN
ncbi:MAG: hypothetical protein ACEPOW_04280 [Bacteroidales bacterium]